MKDLNAAEFEKIVYDEEKPCLVLFSRTNCHVCQEVHPMLEEIEQDYEGKDFGFYHVDVEEEKGLYAQFSLKGVPQVLFFNQGAMLARYAGKKDEDEYIQKINEIMGQ